MHREAYPLLSFYACPERVAESMLQITPELKLYTEDNREQGGAILQCLSRTMAKDKETL